jgi:hypothetical protein
MRDITYDPKCPDEYRSVDNFVKFIEDDERPYTVAEVEELGYWLHATPLALHKILRERGLTCAGQKVERDFRTVDDNPNNRWTSYKSYGGGGGSCLLGFAGTAG